MKQCYLDHDGTSVVLVGNHYFGNGSQYTQQLTQQGLAQDRDYNWAYYPAVTWTHQNLNQERPAESFTKITFVDPKMATYYSIKWSK
jgi:hypothetical protein